MERNKYNAKFYDKDKKLNQESEPPEVAPPLTDESEVNVEFGRDCQEEFERLRRERNKEKNLK
ncbi:MAG: hypothetical protein WBK54_02435 [Bacilli bacterium]|jgi:hypothetical protein|nr:hypothetical protein [Acholeplasmataceae bacterium]